MLTDAARAQIALNEERARTHRAEYLADEHAQRVADLKVGDWVATSWLADTDRPRCGYVVGIADATDTEPRRVDVFEPRPEKQRVADETQEPCDLCGLLPGAGRTRWVATSFRCPTADIIEVHPATAWSREVAARKIVQVIADAPGNRWTDQHTRRLLMALTLVGKQAAAA